MAVPQSNSALIDILQERIANSPQQRITFADYMDLVLYHDREGYYSRGRGLGETGDFVTSVHLCPDFGEMLAEQFVQMWEILGKPQPFSLLELGAGQGILAGDVLSYIERKYPEFLEAIDYTIVEKSRQLKAQQQQRLKTYNVRWFELEEIPENAIVGCIFSNEFFDALPVHLFGIEQGELKEIYVTIKNNELVETIGEPSTPDLKNYFANLSIEIGDRVYEGYRSEVNLAALEWIEAISKRLQRGYVLTIDYGYPAARYYQPHRREGTLQCYYRHHFHDDPYAYVGEQDLTAHVNFTALEIWGARSQLVKLGFAPQALFLMALGIGDRIAEISNSSNSVDLTNALHRRQVLHRLIDPMGVGNFGVLIQAKGLDSEQKSQVLRGLQTR